MSLCTCRRQFWQPCQKILGKSLKIFCSNSQIDGEFKRFPKNLFLLKMFVWTCTKKIWQPCRNLVAKKTKNFPKFQKKEATIFWSEFFSHQKWFFSNGECNFDNPTKNFSPKNQRFAPQISKNDEKNIEFFERKIFILKLCFCTCWIQLRPPCQKFLVRTLKNFARIPVRMKKLCAFQKSYSLKCSSKHAQEILAGLP